MLRFPLGILAVFAIVFLAGAPRAFSADDLPPTAWFQMARQLKPAANESVRLLTIATLEDYAIWPESIWEEIPALVTDQSAGVRQGALKALATQSIWPYSFWNKFVTFFLNTH
ncbi:MAG: hypothetical protein HY075_08820, partial [Deltaproteobacteria bacterium]|nr:hypothetical protein [Deltaproteobacteria bacterium]